MEHLVEIVEDIELLKWNTMWRVWKTPTCSQQAVHVENLVEGVEDIELLKWNTIWRV